MNKETILTKPCLQSQRVIIASTAPTDLNTGEPSDVRQHQKWKANTTGVGYTAHSESGTLLSASIRYGHPQYDHANRDHNWTSKKMFIESNEHTKFMSI